MIYHDSLDFLWQSYQDYLQAKAYYDRVREELFWNVRTQVNALIEKQTKPEDILNQSHGMRLVQYYDSDFKPTKKEEREIFGMYLWGNWDDNEWNVFVTEMNKIAPDWFDGNRYVFQNFFGKNVDSLWRFELWEKTLQLYYKEEKAKIIEEARYKWVRQKEALLFQDLCKYLWTDFRGIFLFSASWPTSFCMNWDYVDAAYKEVASNYGYNPWIIEQLQKIWIKNPQNIPFEWDGFRTHGANKLSHWIRATESNKTTQVIHAWVGSKEWPKSPIKYHNYDLAFAESDQTWEKRLTAWELYKLAKIWGYIILPHRLLKFSHWFSDKVKLLLDSSEWDFSLLKKVA